MNRNGQNQNQIIAFYKDNRNCIILKIENNLSKSSNSLNHRSFFIHICNGVTEFLSWFSSSLKQLLILVINLFPIWSYQSWNLPSASIKVCSVYKICLAYMQVNFQNLFLRLSHHFKIYLVTIPVCRPPAIRSVTLPAAGTCIFNSGLYAISSTSILWFF